MFQPILRMSALLGLMMAPLVAFGQVGTFPTGGGGGGIQDIFTILLDIFSSYVIPLIVTIALIYFIWGVAKFILSGDDPQTRTEGRDMMIYGIIALFVIISVWGLVAIINQTFHITAGGAAPPLPQIPQ